MLIFPHPNKFRALYLKFLSTWTALRDTTEAIEELQGEAPNPILEETLSDANDAFTVWFQSALYHLHQEILQACHDHCVEPPEWLDRGLDQEDPEFPELPFRCACGLDHDWEYCPVYLSPSEGGDAESGTDAHETS